jgi:hypothetical protein
MADDFKKLADDALSFPVLTEEVSFPGGPDKVGAGSGTAPLSQKVNIALREILGWRPRSNDPRGFLASLNQSFEVKEVEGHVSWTWRPRTFAAEADLGAITGAQASIYTRARASLDQSLPLLDGLTPLRADYDPEDVDAARAIVRSSFTELVYELGVEGGPQLARVDGYFLDLLGPIADPNGTAILTNPEEVGGQLALLRDEFGLVGEQVNTIDEEQNLTNFFILVDSINSLWLTWRTQRGFFDHRDNGKAFLGTQFVLLSRNLAVLNESVEEVYFAMNSVFLGPAERQVTKIILAGGETVFLGETLNWVQRFATEEGPRLLREGGKDGVINAFRPTLDRLIRLVSGIFAVSASNSNNPTAGFHSARVRRSLEELKINLESTRENARLISRLPAPDIRLVEPQNVSTGGSPGNLLLTVSGNNFNPSAKLSLKLPNQSVLQPEEYIFVTQTMIRAIFDLPASSQAGSTGLLVIATNPDGQFDEAVLTIGNVPGNTLAPQITNVQPGAITITNSAELENFKVTAFGSNFQAGATLTLIIDDQIADSKQPATVTPPNKIEAVFDLTGILPVGFIAEGKVVVTNPDGQSDETEAGHGVIITFPLGVASAPQITDAQPDIFKVTDPAQLDNFKVTVSGSDFQAGATMALKIQGRNAPVLSKAPATVTPPDGIEAVFDLKGMLIPGRASVVTVVVTNPDKQQDDEVMAITYDPQVGAPPSITSVTPNPVKIIEQKQLGNLKLKITGSDFKNDTKVSLKIQGKDVDPKSPVSFKSSTEIEAVFDLKNIVKIQAGQTIGGKVIVTNPGVQQAGVKDLTIQYETSPGKGPAVKPNVPG